MENVHEGFEKYNCHECAKISYKIFMNKWKNSIIINVVNILPKDSSWKYILKMFMKYKRSDMNQLMTSWKWSAFSKILKKC